MRYPDVISMDPPQSRDLDDAISVERIGSRWIVDVCVPDVPSLLGRDGKHDGDARKRVVTRYGGSFIRQGMLPEALVSGLSLTPHRRTPMCWFRLMLGEDLSIEDVQIRRIRHRTAARMTYLEADEALAKPGHDHHQDISTMWDLAMRLHARRRVRTGASFDVERHQYTNEEGLILQMGEMESHRSHLIVMELMILVNEALAGHCHKKGIPVIYRNHRPRDMSSGLRQDVRREMSEVEGLGPEEASERMKALASRIGPASFGVSPEGHWGLDVSAYGYFTSPLRRYCDIVNIRALVHGDMEPDLPETARHIDATTREQKEESAEHHGKASRRHLAAMIARVGRACMEGRDIHTILRACIENGVVAEEVQEEVQGRMDRGALSGKDIEAVFTHGRSLLPAAFLEEMGKWISSDRQRQIVLVRDMVLRQRIVRIPSGEDGRENVSLALREISDKFGMNLSEDWMRHEDEIVEEMIDNPKGALLELAAILGADVDFEETGRVGPSHQPRFTITCLWKADGIETEGRGSGSSVKEATRMAAWEVYRKVEAQRPKMQEKVNEAKNPKSLLLEVAAGHGGEVVFTTLGTEGPSHKPIFLVSVVYRHNDVAHEARGSGGSRKEAERMAAQNVLAALKT